MDHEAFVQAVIRNRELIAQLRTSLARVTAERDDLDIQVQHAAANLGIAVAETDRERAAHAETRKALDNAMSILSSRDEIAEAALESTRASAWLALPAVQSALMLEEADKA